jgi:tRNA G18 (ribose-2'-O)-methylase SpoU
VFKRDCGFIQSKVVQATMGSIARVNVSYVDSFLSSTDLPVLAPLWRSEHL